MISKICEVCSKRFEVHKYRKNTARFCSCKCRAKVIMAINTTKGRIPWNKGMRGKYSVNGGESNGMWRGDKVTYSSLHYWVRYHKGKAKKCSDCGSEKHIQWSNESGRYLRDLDDWKERCPKCNSLHDRKLKLNKIRDKFPEIDKLFSTRYQR